MGFVGYVSFYPPLLNSLTPKKHIRPRVEKGKCEFSISVVHIPPGAHLHSEWLRTVLTVKIGAQWLSGRVSI